MQNISFNNVTLKLVNGNETLKYGGNIDLRPAADIKMQIFEHDIPGLYAQFVDGLIINNLKLEWGENLPDYFTNGIECLEVKDLSIFGFDGIHNPNSPESKAIKLEKTTLKKRTKL
jgi:hypothetical protein